MTPDLINGLFEVIGGFLLWRNVYVLLQDRKVRGVSMIPTTFFCLWGYWNLFYYPSLSQWLSLFGGVNVVAANSVWVALMFKYRKN